MANLLDIRQEWQEDSSILKSISQVLGTMGVNKGSHPRLGSAAFVSTISRGGGELEKALRALCSNPTMPMVLVGSGDLEKDAKTNPEIARIIRFPNVRVVSVTQLL